MNRALSVLIALMSVFYGTAQMPKWLIPADYDTIFVKQDNCLLQTVKDRESSLWTMDGEKIFTTDQTILPFKDGVATIINEATGKIVGFVDRNANFKPLPNPSIAFDNPFFEDGYLTVLEDYRIAYYDKDGNRAMTDSYVLAYPFHRGYAPYLTYENFSKLKDPHYRYFKADGKPLEYIMISNGERKPLDPKNIEFLSGISPDGKAVAVIKGKLYWFDPLAETFSPLLGKGVESEKKRHLSIDKDYEPSFFEQAGDSVVIKARFGKDQTASLKFNNELIPELFVLGDEKMTFTEPVAKPFSYSSDVTGYGPRPYGLEYNSHRILPGQFQDVGLSYGNRVFVKTGDKWGIVEVIPGIDFSLKLNKGEDVAFRHQKFETQIRLDLPAQISAKDARIDIPETTGCMIDKTSRETRDTESGNFVTYDCVLNIPLSLPDTITTITYSPVSVSYDGFKMFDAPLSIRAWHLKYYNVDPIETETSIDNGVASFTININAQKNIGEGDYPFEVKIEADSLSIDFEKLSETRYKCLVSNLREGDNNINIIVTEKGCPPSVFPFEINYTKPAPKEKQEEKVVIRKKAPAVRKQSVNTPRLPI